MKNVSILENLKALDEAQSKIVLRCPVIPGVNDTEQHFAGIANLANTFKNILAIELEPYHGLGNSKYARLGKPEQVQTFETPDARQVADWIAQIQTQTSVPIKKA